MQGRYQTADQALVREMNLSIILRYLHAGGPMSRASLASLAGLNKTTVSSLADELRRRGLIHDVGLDNTRAGRPATLLELNPDAGLIAGVALGVDFVSVILADFVGQIRWRRLEAVDPGESQQDIVRRTQGLVDEAIGFGRDAGRRILGLGIATPGTVDVDRGLLIFSPNLQWRDVAYRKIFRRTGLPVLVDNDANAAAQAEHLFGVARQAQNFLCVFGGVGIGGGLFLDGKLYRGAGGFAGEIGHTNLMAEGYRRPCRCGSRGCWETLVAQDSIVERVRTRLLAGRNSLVSRLMAERQVSLGLPLIVEAARAGDAQCREALAEAGALLGLGVANLVSIFNPEMVVLGGPISAAQEFLLPLVREAVSETTMPEIRQQVQIVASPFGADASVVGAVALVVEAIFANPTSVGYLNDTPAHERR